MDNKNTNNNREEVVLVTGAGEGIGQATAEMFATLGYRVACLGRHSENTTGTAEEIRENGGKAIPVVGDISRYGEMESAVARIRDEWGRLDVVVANAGVNGVWAPIEDLQVEEFESTLRINLIGTFHTIKAAVPLLKVRGGSVVIIASINGNRIFSTHGATAYSCSKAGQVAMMKMLALELADRHIRVNSVCPGSFKTNISDNTEKRNREDGLAPVIYPEDQIPLTGGKAGRREDCAELICFLAGPSAAHITGTNVVIDGAESLLKG